MSISLNQTCGPKQPSTMLFVELFSSKFTTIIDKILYAVKELNSWSFINKRTDRWRGRLELGFAFHRRQRFLFERFYSLSENFATLWIKYVV